MKKDFLRVLACPECRTALSLHDDSAGEAIVSGDLSCSRCRAVFRIERDIPRFVASDSYVRSFSFEWNRFQTTQLDSVDGRGESRERFAQSFNFDPSQLKGRLVLDAGCGMGRFAEIALANGATVVGADLSLAIEAAYRNLGHHPNAHFVQADLWRLPFAPETFDVIYSLGVLHHTPDARKSFDTLVKYLKPGGVISITLYSGYNRFYVQATNFWRRLTPRLPARLLYALSHAAIPLYYLYRLPVVGVACQGALPISMHPDPTWRTLDTFDCYSPTYQSYHTHPEVYKWFAEANLTNIAVLEPGISFIGTKPVRGTHAAST